MPAKMRVEIRCKKMGALVREVEDGGKNRFERFKFYDIAGLDALGDFNGVS